MSKREDLQREELAQVPGRYDIPPKIGTVISRGVVRRGGEGHCGGRGKAGGWMGAEGTAIAGCWWRIERDQDDGIGVAGWSDGRVK